MKMLKKIGYKIIQKMLNLFVDKFKLDLYYDLYQEDSLINKRFYNIGAGRF